MPVLLNIDVPDLAAAESFYTSAFDLVVSRRFGDGFIELRGWEAPVYLLKKGVGTLGAGSDARRYGRHWTPIHCDVVVADLDAALSRAVSAGAIVESPPRLVPYGKLAMLADPFGHGFCLIEFNASGYDALLSPRG